VPSSTTYAAGCLLCGRTLGFVIGRQFVRSPNSPGIQRDGRRLRCGYCSGSVLLESDPTVNPPDWAAEMERELAAS
jgi:hypothetical protein